MNKSVIDGILTPRLGHCVMCNQEFETVSPRRLYCDSCRKEKNREWSDNATKKRARVRTMVCESCGGEFQAKVAQYCPKCRKGKQMRGLVRYRQRIVERTPEDELLKLNDDDFLDTCYRILGEA